MTETVIGSAKRDHIIGFDKPFTIIGERINPTGRKLLAEEMKNGDFSRVEADAIAQIEAGAHMLDVNAGIPLADEPALLAQAIELVQSLSDVPICIDSSIVEALDRGLQVYKGRALVNSVTGELEQLERVMQRLSAMLPTTVSKRAMWSSIRWSCQSVLWVRPGDRYLILSGAYNASSSAIPPVAHRTSASVCPIETVLTVRSCRWPSHTE